MAQMIFVNLPVKDLKRSKDFFGRLGYTFNPQFTDDTAACMVISDTIFAMLLTHEKFQQFTPREICDATKRVELWEGGRFARLSAQNEGARERLASRVEGGRNAVLLCS